MSIKLVADIHKTMRILFSRVPTLNLQKTNAINEQIFIRYRQRKKTRLSVYIPYTLRFSPIKKKVTNEFYQNNEYFPGLFLKDLLRHMTWILQYSPYSWQDILLPKFPSTVGKIYQTCNYSTCNTNNTTKKLTRLGKKKYFLRFWI